MIEASNCWTGQCASGQMVTTPVLLCSITSNVCVCSLREKLKGQYYGGELVDQAVNAVFAALIWHCQDLREELTLSGPLTPSQLLQDAFSTAEALRRDLVTSAFEPTHCAYCPPCDV